MLTFNNRFHGYNALRYTYKNGQAVRSGHLTIKSHPNIRRKTPRIAVVVSKKVHKGAVGRNRIRRRLYELFRHELSKLTPNVDIICIVTSSEVRTMTADELYKELASSLQRANLYKQNQ
jgi:ribonuclease P protein component